MIHVESFATWEEALERMAQQGRAADARVQPWQTAVQPGDCFLRTDQIVPIYGQVLDPPAEDRGLYAQEHMRHFRLTHCFSAMCPEGEVGDTHVSCFAHLLTPEEFAAAQAAGWKEPEDADAREDAGLHPLYICPRHSPSLGLFAEDPQQPGVLVCGCPRRKGRVAGWE